MFCTSCRSTAKRFSPVARCADSEEPRREVRGKGELRGVHGRRVAVRCERLGAVSFCPITLERKFFAARAVLQNNAPTLDSQHVGPPPSGGRPP